MKVIQIDGDFIKLDTLLKLADIAETGGHAKLIIKDEIVSVNGEIITQRGKKIFPGDKVIVHAEEDYIIKVVL